MLVPLSSFLLKISAMSTMKGVRGSEGKRCGSDLRKKIVLREIRKEDWAKLPSALAVDFSVYQCLCMRVAVRSHTCICLRNKCRQMALAIWKFSTHANLPIASRAQAPYTLRWPPPERKHDKVSCELKTESLDQKYALIFSKNCLSKNTFSAILVLLRKTPVVEKENTCWGLWQCQTVGTNQPDLAFQFSLPGLGRGPIRYMTPACWHQQVQEHGHKSAIGRKKGVKFSPRK